MVYIDEASKYYNIKNNRYTDEHCYNKNTS